jgi:hypothetical protein
MRHAVIEGRLAPSADAVNAAQRGELERWPLAKTVAFAGGLSLALWAAVISFIVWLV